MAERLTQTAYAKKRGVTQQYISKLVKKGIIETHKGKIDPVQADKAIEENSSPARATKKKKTTFVEAQIAKEVARAHLLALDVKIKTGEYVKAEDVKNLFVAHISSAKTQLLAIPAKCTQEIKHLKLTLKGKALDVKIQEVLAGEIKEILKEMSDWRP